MKTQVIIFTLKFVELISLDEEVSLSGNECVIGEEVGEEITRPSEAIGLGPVPIVNIGSVCSVLNYPPLVPFSVLRHYYYYNAAMELVRIREHSMNDDDIERGFIYIYIYTYRERENLGTWSVKFIEEARILANAKLEKGKKKGKIQHGII